MVFTEEEATAAVAAGYAGLDGVTVKEVRLGSVVVGVKGSKTRQKP